MVGRGWRGGNGEQKKMKKKFRGKVIYKLNVYLRGVPGGATKKAFNIDILTSKSLCISFIFATFAHGSLMLLPFLLLAVAPLGCRLYYVLWLAGVAGADISMEEPQHSECKGNVSRIGLF